MIKINLDKKLKYLLGCSYGPDSMALFDLLLKNGYNFAVGHVNYALRDEASKETEDLIKYCDKNGIKIFVKYVNEKIEKNIEEKCREIRYNFFKELQSNYFYDSLIIAHNLDDNIETFLLQKKRHNITEIFGLNIETEIFGIKVVRPLLDYSKDELKKYDDDNNVPYCIDSSNENDVFERNKVRHMVVSKLSKQEKLAINREIIEVNKQNYEKRAKILQKSPVKITELLTYNNEELAYYFTIKGRTYISNLEMSLKLIKELRKVMESSKPNVLVKIKNNLYFEKSYGEARMTMLSENVCFNYIIEKPCEFKCPYFELNFTDGAVNRNVRDEDYPLTIRNAKSTDTYQVNGYNVSMRRQFINWKMPKELRNRWPIIINKSGSIIYVPKYSAEFVNDESSNFIVMV